MPIKILILCTGNSCRSQMAEGILKYFNQDLFVCSAGTQPAKKVNPYAIKIMQEISIDISAGKTENVEKYLNDEWDYVVTVCRHADENCPVFLGKVKQRMHIGFDDPALATGTDEEIMTEFRRVRNEIERDFKIFYKALKSTSTGHTGER